MRTLTSLLYVLAYVLAVHVAPCAVIIRVASGGGGGGTDWTADSNMKGLYYFESGSFEQDSKSTNHVDDAASAATPSADTTNKIEGSQSAQHTVTGTDTGSVLAQANMTADFPCNGTGDGEITIAGWIRQTTLRTAYVANIADGVAGKFYLQVLSTGELKSFLDGSGGTSFTTTATPMTANNWFFVAAVYSDSGNELMLYWRQQGGGSSTVETTTSNVGTLDDIGGSGTFTIGGRYDNSGNTSVEGSIDALAVINGDALTQAELDGVFLNGWDGDGW